jgi:hypothetical protein
MNKKLFYFSIFLIFVLFLSNCSTGIPSDEVKIESVINNFCSAINTQNWNSARSYCVYESEAYLEVGIIEDLINSAYSYGDIITFNYMVDILNVSISGNYAQAYAYITETFSCNGQPCEGLSDSSISNYGNLLLQKIGSSWKLYGDNY